MGLSPAGHLVRSCSQSMQIDRNRGEEPEAGTFLDCWWHPALCLPLDAYVEFVPAQVSFWPQDPMGMRP